MRREAQDIIIRPLITEKGTKIQETTNQFFFEVKKNSNKVEIRNAVEKLFDVKVTKVSTMNMPGKWKRLGRFMGRSNGWKKAIVTLKDGDSIELFEGV